MKAQIYNKRYWIKETDPVLLHDELLKLAKQAGFQVLRELTYHFKPQGYTAIFLLAESHLAVHTFPEENKTYIELSSCNKEKQARFKKMFNLSVFSVEEELLSK